MARLPNPGSDAGNWGSILNDYLAQAHTADGMLKPAAVTAAAITDGAVTIGKLAVNGGTNGQLLSKDSTQSGGFRWTDPSGVPDATLSSKGSIQLAGDLSGTAASPTVPGLASKEPSIAAGTTSQYYRGDKTWQTLDKGAVALANVDNTSDATKPVSSAAQTALNAKQSTSEKGQLNGYASLDSSGKVPSAQLPASTALTIEMLPAGSTVTVQKAGSWPVRPTARTDITVQWKGVDPSPTIVASGTGGMLDNVDIRLVTPA